MRLELDGGLLEMRCARIGRRDVNVVAMAAGNRQPRQNRLNGWREAVVGMDPFRIRFATRLLIGFSVCRMGIDSVRQGSQLGPTRFDVAHDL